MAQIYVGTYAKYNNGNLFGAWLELENFTDLDDFLEECKKLHEDEADPEFMFQDYEGFPSKFYGESHIDPEVWEWLELDEDDRKLTELYWEYCSDDATIKQVRERFYGKFDNRAHWAEDYLESTGALSTVPENMRSYFDYDSFARDCQLNGDLTFVEHESDTYVFNNNC